jgi:lactate dehydrogenase-like 2-hydroxyacid dehydrogenase
MIVPMTDLYLHPALPAFLTTPLAALGRCHRTLDKACEVVVVPGGLALSTQWLDALPGLRLISVFGVGYDGVPLDYCRSRQIAVTNTPDVLTDDVADIATALVLMTSRNLGEAERFTRAGRWLAGPLPLAHALRGKTAGVLGMGRIGKAIAKRLEAHGMQLCYHGRRAQSDLPWRWCPSLLELAEGSDFLVVACPGGAQTHHLVDAQVLAALGPTGTLINIARGSVVDTAALITALQTGAIRAAGLDVYEQEPQIPPALLDSPRCVLLPHVGSATHETRQAMADLVLANVKAYAGGQPLLTLVL